ncbi:VOC family protein [Erythrobacter aurantius]|uniref:VOC family protein n=1 Tax=Erythrobacter aurantius TaxID=2909249 RepID=UPI00207A4651|nr:VOC family protein [Erythrobacter aurantius]
MIANLGYVVLSSADLAQWRRFGTETIGAMNASETDDRVALKIDEHPFRVLILSGDADRLAAIGWEMVSSDQLDAMRLKCADAGLPICEGTADEADARCVTNFFWVSDPAGNRVEFYHGRTGCGEPFTSPICVGGFVTGEMGLGHLVISAAGVFDETHAFYTRVLGLGDSDDLTLPPPAEGAPEMRVRFLHVDNPRHHSLALFNLPSPTGVVHLMFEMTEMDDVGRCLDRVNAQGWSLMASLGRHCNDDMFSFYVIGPGGVPFEIGHGGLQVDWSTTEPTVSTVPDYWGHQYQVAT